MALSIPHENTMGADPMTTPQDVRRYAEAIVE